MSRLNDDHDFEIVIEESQKDNILYKVTMKMDDVEKIFESQEFLLDIIQDLAALIERISQIDNNYIDFTNKLKIQVDLDKMRKKDDTIQYLLDQEIIQQAPQAFKLFFPNGIQ